MPVHALNTEEEFQRYATFGHEVYQQNPYWVVPDTHHLISLLSGKAPSGAHAHVQAFWIEEGDSLRATLTAVVDDLYNRHWNERMGHLLLFEALPHCDDQVQVLFHTACAWLQGHRCHAARVALLNGWQFPLTIDAYDAVPTVIHTYNPPYYHSYIKNAGFQTERGQVQYQVQFTPALARRYQQMVEHALLSGVRLRSWDFTRLEDETVLLTTLFNDTFAAHWGVRPTTVPEMQGVIGGLKDMLVADFTGFAEAEGQTVGFVFALPDLNQAFHRMRGKGKEANMAEYRELLQAIDHGVLNTIGVKQPYRGRGINLALAAKSYLAMIARGYKTGSYTLVLDDNWRSRRTAEKLGGRVTRNFVTYRKEFA